MNKLLIVLVILLLASTAWALRIPRPIVLKNPPTEDQIAQLNRFLEDVWNMQGGRYEMDIVATSKTAAKNGEAWLIKTGSVVRLQYRANNHVFTITPDGF